MDVIVIPTNRPIARKDDQDLVFKTAREKFNAVIEKINELVEEGRPVLVGTTTVEISELLGRMLQMKNIPHQVLNAKQHQKEAEIVQNAGKAGAVTIATNMAGRGTDIKLQEGVKEAGGLAIIGTERHDSRRVDRQLRGRSGRQGDPGSSQFFVCLEDDLMRKFGSDRIAKLMDRVGLKEGEVITHPMVSKSIERAQKKVEENNFGIRKRLLEYDDVMNAQRKAIYKKRKNALFGDRLDLDTDNMLFDVSDSITQSFGGTESYKEFELELLRVLGVQSPVTEKNTRKLTRTNCLNWFTKKYELTTIGKTIVSENDAMPTIKQVLETEGNKYKNISFELSDGRKEMSMVVNLEEAFKTNGKAIGQALERNVTLGLIDNEWKEHLREMDDLRSAVHNAQYEQKDPLLIYKWNHSTYSNLCWVVLNQETVETLIRMDVPQNQQIQSTNNEAQRQSAYDKAQINTQEAPSRAPQQFAGSQGYQEAMQNSHQQVKQQPVVADEKIGRNDACPCGSGKKYKQCHGK